MTTKMKDDSEFETKLVPRVGRQVLRARSGREFLPGRRSTEEGGNGCEGNRDNPFRSMIKYAISFLKNFTYVRWV